MGYKKAGQSQTIWKGGGQGLVVSESVRGPDSVFWNTAIDVRCLSPLHLCGMRGCLGTSTVLILLLKRKTEPQN